MDLLRMSTLAVILISFSGGIPPGVVNTVARLSLPNIQRVTTFFSFDFFIKVVLGLLHLQMNRYRIIRP